MCYNNLDECGENHQFTSPCVTGELDEIQGVFIRDEEIPFSNYYKNTEIDKNVDVIDVTPQSDYTLKLQFADGKKGFFDVWPEIVFYENYSFLKDINPLKDIDLFMKTYLDEGCVLWSGVDFELHHRHLYENCMNFEEYHLYCASGKINREQSINDAYENLIDEYETCDEEMMLNEISICIREEDGFGIEITIDSNDHFPAYMHVNDTSDHTLIARVLIPTIEPQDVNDVKSYNCDELTDELKMMIFKALTAQDTTGFKPINILWKVQCEWNSLHNDDWDE